MRLDEPAQTEMLAPAAPEVQLLDLLTWLGERKALLLTSALAGALLATALAFWLPDTYTARASMVPPQQQGSSSGAAAAVAALGALGGLAASLGTKSPDELYATVLTSNSVVQALDQRFQLRDRYGVDGLTRLKTTLGEMVKVTPEKKAGVITIDVKDADPVFAATLANAHIEELAKVLDRLALTEAQQRRDFYEKRLDATKKDLIKADQDFQRLQENSGMLVIDKQAEALLSAIARVRAQVVEREVQLRVLLGTATPQNPDVQRLQAEVAAMRIELKRMENAQDSRGDSVGTPAGRFPAVAGDYVRARREIKFQETLIETLLKQYELAKLDVAREGPAIQVVDQATPPDRKSGPKRGLIILGGLLIGLGLGAAWIVLRRYVAWSIAQDPQGAQSWSALRRAWGLRG